MRRADFDPVSIEIFNKQLKKVTLFVLAVFGVLILRLWFLQVVTGPIYRTKSEKNRIRVVDIPPFRGLILDRNGKVLVDNRPSYDLYVIPEEVHDQKWLLDNLVKMVGIDPVAAEKKFAQARRYPFRPVCLKNSISRDELAVIETHRFNLPGTMIKVSSQRCYVYGKLASHLLGYLGEISEDQLKVGDCQGSKAGDLVGISGVELRWQSLLSGMRGGEQVEVDAAGRKIRVISRSPPVMGATVFLTIDKNLQARAERCLKGKKGAIVALDPNDGEVLALASSPAFDPNIFIKGIDKKSWETIISSKSCPLQNRALCGQYPPASVFKIIVALAGLEEGIIDPREELLCKGSYAFGDRKYRCWKRYGHGKVDLYKALKESCDIYFYEIGKRLGVSKIALYAKKFGLGKKTGIDIGKEEEGLIPTPEWKLNRFHIPWQPGETLSLSIGQSFLLVTPIQMASLISAVFNGGHLYKPQITKQVLMPDGKEVYGFEPRLNGNVGIKDEYLEFIKKALTGVVNEPHGTGRMAMLKHVTVAGKTGTAQVIATEKEREAAKHGKISLHFMNHAWFVAVAPADNPRIALAILIEHGGHGGSAAAPIARELIGTYLKLDGS